MNAYLWRWWWFVGGQAYFHCMDFDALPGFEPSFENRSWVNVEDQDLVRAPGCTCVRACVSCVRTCVRAYVRMCGPKFPCSPSMHVWMEYSHGLRLSLSSTGSQ